MEGMTFESPWARREKTVDFGAEKLYSVYNLLHERDAHSMPENDSYALWIMPEGDAYFLTDSYIATLSSTYNLPKFEPHVTILAGIPQAATSKVRGFAESLAPFRIRLATSLNTWTSISVVCSSRLMRRRS